MKPSELYLGARRFFGALIPGCIWVTAVGLCIVATPLSKFVDWGHVGAIQVSMFLGISYLVGVVLQPVSFHTATSVASSRLLVNSAVSRLRWGQRQWNAGFGDRVTN